jgi:predicted O-methyltransferase YrrM
MTDTTALPQSGSCSLDDPKVQSVLAHLHHESRSLSEGVRILREFSNYFVDKALRRRISVQEEAARLKDTYISLSAKQGKFAYLVARGVSASRIVEFGTSFGISTIYLAAAVRDNGGGTVIGTEIEPTKVVAARANLEAAGLGEYAEVREGDARETLQNPGGPVDMVLLDGFKELYLPILKLLTPYLRPGAVVLGDNIFTFRIALAPYVAYVANPANGFSSVTLFLGDGTEYSVKL